MHRRYKLIFIPLGYGEWLAKKTTLKPKLAGAGLRQYPKYFGPPTYFCNHWSQLLQIWYTTWALGVAYQETVRPKLVGVGPRGASQKFWDPLLISATIEASNFKFGTQLGFGEYVTITALVPNLVEADWATATRAPQKLCGPGTMYPVPRNSYRNVMKPQI